MLTRQPYIPFVTEKLLQFIWQHQYFSKHQLYTTGGEPLVVLHGGTLNTDQGPDFLDARIKIGNMLWAGHVELHVRASAWNAHAHGNDVHYQNVILHAVWQQDTLVHDASGKPLPTLELQPLVSVLMLQRYVLLMESQDFVSCASQLPVLPPLSWLAWKERLVAERLESRSRYILELLGASQHHWDEVFWWLLARNFGIKVNSDHFEQLARTLPVTLLAKHKHQIHQLEALLLGQAGLLEATFTGDYPLLLQREYRYLQKKYRLQPLKKGPSFLRMRPASFPTVRLAQLAMLVHRSVHLFSHIREACTVEQLKSFFDVTANDYWHCHYRPDEPTVHQPKKLGGLMVENLVINTIVPVLFTYGGYTGEEALKQRAVNWLLQLLPEQNRVTRQWKAAGVTNHHALDSQALLELKTHYCNHRRCLHCAVGNQLLKIQVNNDKG